MCNVNHCISCLYTNKNKCTDCEGGYFLSIDNSSCGTECSIGILEYLAIKNNIYS